MSWYQETIDSAAREAGTIFYGTGSYGFYGYAFADLGEKYPFVYTWVRIYVQSGRKGRKGREIKEKGTETDGQTIRQRRGPEEDLGLPAPRNRFQLGQLVARSGRDRERR
jgi:hypothetical protein